MHEIGIVQSTLELAARCARDAGARRISEIRMRVGRMTGVVPEAIEHAFAVLRQGTIASEAVLTIDYVSGRAWCHGCSVEFAVDGLLSECPTCCETSFDLRAGQELELVSLEVVDDVS